MKMVENTSRDPQWRPLDESEIRRAKREREDPYWKNNAAYSPDECYWRVDA